MLSNFIFQRRWLSVHSIATQFRPELPPTLFLLFHKPRGVIVARTDVKHPTVFSCLPPWFLTEGWLPIGRLDKDSPGLLLFARDSQGKLMNVLSTHTNVVKSYNITIRGFLSDEHVKEMLSGVQASP
jgi:23S rRNA pseudouridine2605 synthase